MNLPNALTLLRIVLVPVFMLFGFMDGIVYDILSLLIFIVASITDHIDGHLARKHNLITNFGKIMDPLADKLLVTSAFLVFVAQGRMGVVPVMIILAREFAVTSLRVVAAGNGKVMAAGMSGKIKTVSQIVYIILMLLNIGKIPFIPETLAYFVEQTAMWIITAITVWSGIDYFAKNKELIKSSLK